jgi:hypothetical protein
LKVRYADAPVFMAREISDCLREDCRDRRSRSRDH